MLYESEAGLTASDSQLWTQDSPNVAGTSESYDEFGYALAAANFGKSAHADLLIGVPGEDVGDVTDAGAVQVLYGSVAGLTSVGNGLWTQNSTGIRSPVENGDHFGSAVVAGDFGKSGYADAAVSSVFEAVGKLESAGVVHVLFGGSAGLTSSKSQMWSQNSAGIPGSTRGFENFGSK